MTLSLPTRPSSDPANARRSAPGRESGRSDQLQLKGLGYGTGAVTYADLGQDVRHVVRDRALGHAQRVGDLLVGEARGHQPQDLGLAVGQRVGPVEADE